jgi:hypothetical protein
VQGKLDACAWNTSLGQDSSPVLFVCHGTTETSARQIIDVGFATLSLLDQGWFGKGMYFTTSATYAKAYAANKSNTVLILCMLTLGNVFPVVEDTSEAQSLMGKSCQNGYSSHYVCTASNGQPVKSPGTNKADELVIFQESQVLPVYIVELA